MILSHLSLNHVSSCSPSSYVSFVFLSHRSTTCHVPFTVIFIPFLSSSLIYYSIASSLISHPPLCCLLFNVPIFSSVFSFSLTHSLMFYFITDLSCFLLSSPLSVWCSLFCSLFAISSYHGSSHSHHLWCFHVRKLSFFIFFVSKFYMFLFVYLIVLSSMPIILNPSLSLKCFVAYKRIFSPDCSL